MLRTMIIYVDLAAHSREAAAFVKATQDSGAHDVELRFKPDDPAERVDLVRDADVLVGQRFENAVLAAAAKISWISFWGAGLDTAVTSAMRERIASGLLVTNASGVHGPNIAEHVLALMLAFTRQLPFYATAQRDRIWKKDEGSDRIEELDGQTLGIVGLGRIGDALALRAKAFGMRVLGLKRDPSRRHDATAPVDRIFGLPQLDELLGLSDHVCIALPLTEETRHLFDAQRFSAMRRSARVYNIARGGIVDQAALIAALQKGSLAGAGLDVFEDEPLSPESPLWQMENVIVTPHVAGITPHYFERAAAIYAENLRRFVKHEPLRNRFDPARGY